jgi:hypothetical protein
MKKFAAPLSGGPGLFNKKKGAGTEMVAYVRAKTSENPCFSCVFSVPDFVVQDASAENARVIGRGGGN